VRARQDDFELMFDRVSRFISLFTFFVNTGSGVGPTRLNDGFSRVNAPKIALLTANVYKKR
jgi:hypothetical protein